MAPPGAITNAAGYVGITRDERNTLVITSTVDQLAVAVAQRLGQNDVGWAALWDTANVKPDLSIVGAYGLTSPQKAAPNLGPTSPAGLIQPGESGKPGKVLGIEVEPSIQDVSKALEAGKPHKEPEIEKNTPPPAALPGRGT